MKKGIFVCVILLVLAFSYSCLAAERTVLSAKYGAGYGLLGIEVEKINNSNLGVFGGIGYNYVPSLNLGLRKHSNAQTNNFYYSGHITYIVGVPLPLLSGNIGYEFRLDPKINIRAEGGLTMLLFVPIPNIGLSVGYDF